MAAFSWQLPLGGHGSRLALGTHPFYSFALRAKKRSDQETWDDHVLMPYRGETALIWGHCAYMHGFGASFVFSRSTFSGGNSALCSLPRGMGEKCSAPWACWSDKDLLPLARRKTRDCRDCTHFIPRPVTFSSVYTHPPFLKQFP